MVRIFIRMLQISFEWFKFEFAFECFESVSNGWNLQLKIWFESSEFAFECFKSIKIHIQTLKVWFEWFEFGLECFESLSNGLNLHSNASNLYRMVGIRSFKFSPEFAFECFKLFEFVFERLKFGSNLHSNISNG